MEITILGRMESINKNEYSNIKFQRDRNFIK